MATFDDLEEKHWNIPAAVAALYEKPGTHAHDELTADAYYCLVQAVNSFEAGRGENGGMTLGSFLYYRVRQLVQRYRRGVRGRVLKREGFWDGLLSLDFDTLGDGGGCLADLVPDRRAGEDELGEMRDTARLALSRLSPSDRRIYVAHHAHGYGATELARRVGVTVSAVAYRLERCQRILDRWRKNWHVRRYATGNAAKAKAALDSRSEENRGEHRRKMREGAVRFRKDFAKANRLSGDVPVGRDNWYVLDAGRKLVFGPEPKLSAFAAHLGISWEGVDRKTAVDTFRDRAGGGRYEPVRGSPEIRDLLSAGWGIRYGHELRESGGGG